MATFESRSNHRHLAEEGEWMFRMEKTVDGDPVVFRLSGRIQAEHIADMQDAFDREGKAIVLDLEAVALVDRDVVPVLARWEASGMTLLNCPGYIRESISRGSSNT
jgi:hypothetical protein